MPLIADLLYFKEKQVPCRNLARCIISYRPCIDQGRVHHHQTDNSPQENIPAKNTCGGNGNQYRQKGKCCICHQVEE